jgi:hypothetical protein
MTTLATETMESNSIINLLVNQVKIGMAIKLKITNIEKFIGILSSYDVTQNEIASAIRGAHIIRQKLVAIYDNSKIVSYEKKIQDANSNSSFNIDVAFYKNLCQEIGVDDNDI